METPYLKVNQLANGKSQITEEMVFLSADEEEKYIIGQGNLVVNDDKQIAHDYVVARNQGETKMHNRTSVELMDVSPKQIVSVSTACIPFLEHDDANRALMGANMQRQAIPLLVPEAPFVGTGIEYKAAHDSGSCIVAENSGTVEYVDGRRIKIRPENGVTDEYVLKKFKRTHQGTCIKQSPTVEIGEHYKPAENNKN